MSAACEVTLHLGNQGSLDTVFESTFHPGWHVVQVAKRLPGKHKTSTNQPTNKQINVQRSIKIDKNMPGRVFLAEKM